MRIKRSAQKARQRRDRNRRRENQLRTSGRRSFRCEALESRVLLDSGGLLPDGLLFPLPEPPDPLPPLEPGAISGRVWVDADGNRELNGAEVGQGGVTIYSDFNFNGVLDSNEPSTVTEFDDPVTDFDEGGLYTLAGLHPGWHNVRQVTPDGFEQTFPSLPDGYLPPPWGDASVHVTFVEQGQAVEDVNFGNKEILPGAVTGVKWEDVNGNGQRDDDELGLPGVIIFSDANFNGVPDANEPQTVTSEDDPNTDFDESGQYTLEGLQPGLHWIKEVVPDGFRQTFPNHFFFGDPGLEPGDLIFPGPFPGGAAHDVFIASGQTIDGLDFGNQRIVPGSISGVKWEDANGNAERDPNEPGLAGVTIYADLNNNGVFDSNEPNAITTADIPETDFDEGGRYTLSGLNAGDYVIREVVPDGFRQTFPIVGGPRPLPVEPPTSVPINDFATVEPGRLDLQAGDPGVHDVAITIHANVLVPIEIDVVAAPADVFVINASGPQTNGGGGETSTFQLLILPAAADYQGELQFIDLAGGNVIASIPLSITSGIPGDGAHRVWLDQGEQLEGIDFGNQLVGPSSISGVKWNDINGNGVRDNNEPGLPGVTIYSDLNFNGELDPNEPSVITTADIPETDFDEGGLYSLAVEPGLHSVREIVPDGFRQTFPNFDFPTPLPAPFGAPPRPGEELAHFVHLLPGQSADNIDFGNQRIVPGSISGVKWNDANGNAERDPDEAGLAGVTIYADLNNNGQLDSNEPSAITTADIPETDFDEGGLYTLSGLDAGDYVIREVVPDGFRQTFPVIDEPGPIDPVGGVPVGDFATVEPGAIHLEAGEVSVENLSITIHPNIFVPIDIDVVASPADVFVINTSGPQLNGGGGDTSTFEILILPSGGDYSGELQFIDLAGGNVIASIPLTIGGGSQGDGAHRVTLAAGDQVDSIDFGNQRIGPTTGGVAGRKWLDADGDRQQGPNEPGLAGVIIYADLNRNGVLDDNEPSTVTMEDIPETDFDEAGLYRMELEAGDHWIAEVVPDGFEQTFPLNPVLAIFPPLPGGGVHFVTVAPGQTVDDLNFGNRRVENGSVSGLKWADLNGNGERDANEPGLSGVTIYADYNFNGQLDFGEPSTVTIEDFREIFPNDTGKYQLEVRPGFTAIREIVPDGHFQTFPVSDAASPLEQGAHFVNVESGVNIPDLDFGNQPLDNFPAGVSGRKWEDFNANGQRDADEPGLGGVTIYVDTNLNGRFDPNEPSAVTMDDIPETDFDEGGLYSIGDLQTGFQVIREVVPDGFVQTFPISIAASPLESGAHFVFLAPGEQVDGLDFGNLRFGTPLPGDFNNDGTVNHDDLSLWEEGYGSPPALAADIETPMHGGNFLTWQQNLGRTSVAPPADDGGDGSTEPLPTGLLRDSYRPSTRDAIAAVEAAFAEEPAGGRVAAATLAPVAASSSAESQPVRGAVASRADYAALAAAIDAALEDEFDN